MVKVFAGRRLKGRTLPTKQAIKLKFSVNQSNTFGFHLKLHLCFRFRLHSLLTPLECFVK